MVQLSHPYVTTGKTITLTTWTFVGKVMSLLFNLLSRLVISFLPRSKQLLISWLQSPSAVIFGAQENKVCHCFYFFPIYLPWSDGTKCHDLCFWMLNFKPTFSLSFFTFIKSLFSSFLLSAIRGISFAYLRLLIFLQAILTPACASSSPTFHMMYSAYKLNKQGNNMQPWHTHFPNWNQPIVSCLILSVVSWPAYRFLRRQVRWSGIPISLRIFHTQVFVIHIVKGFTVVNEAEVDVFLEFSCFSYDPTDVGNLISGSSPFSKSSLNIWNSSVHILLKPGLENFEHYFASMWNDCNCVIVWTFFGIALLWDWNENWPFPVLWPLLSFPNLLACWVQYFNSIIF